ncbi:blastula protease 10 [Hyalella azteca]|uniref:Blastula protease 10 n=1 Tax=Hyalella azteca TaxID=294128 RepID=A0A8B7PPU8_HYAAZ|nr:blastula protease 10 [Hyalella azteca]
MLSRDDYLVVIGDNFPNKTIRQNYQKRPTINFDVPYDYSSVLQYYDVFSDTNPRYMLTKDVRFQYQMGSSDGHLSFMNLKLVNRILSCDKLNLKNCGKDNKDPCLNQGYLGASCKCVCPPGTKGDNCETLEMSYNDALIKMKSPETQDITEPNTVVKTIGYPKAEENTWRLYTLVLKADKCKRAVLTFEDFQLSRRSTNGRCMRDALEIRTKFFKGDYDNFCGEDIKKGQVFKSEENDLILHVRSVKPKDNRGWKANFTIEAIKNW